ncbi:MAG TPA: hypothetical protein VFV99_09630 [Kofleriaceae bacterium]|nr:hypothetical protein [Kofleriaceae bacterium]
MRRVLVALMMVFVCATAHAGPKKKQTAQLLSGVGASVSGAVVITGFMTAPDGKRFNAPVMYTGLSMLAITPSFGEFYAGQYLTWGMGIRAVAGALALYTLQTQTHLAVCDNAHSSQDPPCEVFTEGAYPLLGLAAIGFIGGVWYDVLDSGDAVDRYNRANGFSVAPIVPTTSGLAPGMSLSGTF